MRYRERKEEGRLKRERREGDKERNGHSSTLKCRLSGTITDEISEHSM